MLVLLKIEIYIVRFKKKSLFTDLHFLNFFHQFLYTHCTTSTLSGCAIQARDVAQLDSTPHYLRDPLHNTYNHSRVTLCALSSLTWKIQKVRNKNNNPSSNLFAIRRKGRVGRTRCRSIGGWGVERGEGGRGNAPDFRNTLVGGGWAPSSSVFRFLLIELERGASPPGRCQMKRNCERGRATQRRTSDSRDWRRRRRRTRGKLASILSTIRDKRSRERVIPDDSARLTAASH